MKIKESKVFVTGGAGFIGSHIVEELVALGAEVTVYDDFSFGKLDNLAHIKNEINIVEGSILDFELLKNEMKEHDVVSHQAAQLEIFLGADNPIQDLNINTIGTLNVLKAAKVNEVRKVINASSACIYGQTISRTAEDYLPMPNWEYGVSKLAAERYGTIYSKYKNLGVVNLRYAIAYGEREWYRRVLTIFIKRAIQNKPLVVFGDGKQIRDFVYVKDVVKLHNLCIENEAANGQSYNVGTGTSTTIIDLANLVADVAEDVLEYRPTIIFEETKEGDYSKLVPDKKRNTAELNVMLLDIEKAYKELGWKPKTALEQGIRNEMIWAVNNLEYWNKIHYTTG
ncbi:NAD-dependent epimerase/dehydratase family protein [Methanolobus sp. ZRKC2]|uniref:NAD-dependent epimerase/dehydratase family protein n=1 Tax=Methanolobus sp. ZRKC2 TaxID=3125783 RepID=UPI003247DD6A